MSDVNGTPEDSEAIRRPRPNGAESRVGKALRAQLQAGEVVLDGVRFSDPRHGDVEVDFLVLFPDVGVAAIEVKGGTVSFADGQWLTENKGRSRRIDPVRQGRGAKHALRRYLDRQADWHYGLIRSEWFIAMPDTTVVADMGPEARRELLLGSDDIDDMRDRLRSVLTSTLNMDQVPPDGWVDDVVSLLLRGDQSSTGCEVAGPVPFWFGRSRVIGWVAATAAVVATSVLSLGVNVIGGWKGLLGLTAALAVLGYLMRRSKPPIRLIASWRAAIGCVVGLAIGTVLAVGIYGPRVSEGDCHPGYVPCIPITESVDCSEIRMAVRVIGDDEYGLDRDGDGIGCETYA